ncbi:MAG: hypothetical protein ACRCXD_04705 [Luteolibacter sp.]
MKTTLELPDDLFVEAKAVAAQRRITLKTLFTRALERELRPEPPQPAADHFEIDSHGWPVLKRQSGGEIVVSNEFINELRESEGI